jgi:topoisomerase-4 subunit A
VIQDAESDDIACVTNDGYLLIFSASELPVLARGKGLKMMQIPAAKLKKRAEFMMSACVLPRGLALRVTAGSRHITLKPKDLKRYRSERARRGLKLPRGFQKVDMMDVI